jgi:pimeloyl-ACP methyl ester carboxylesterase
VRKIDSFQTKYLSEPYLINYADFGKGDCIVLLHGYLETLDIWSDFAMELSKDFRVVLIDLPGHGKTENAGEFNTMELMAETVFLVLKALNINKVHLCGHSMGGYVSLAFVELFPEMLKSLIIFHSSGNADNHDKIINRNREIELVKNGKKELIMKTNIPFAFAPQNVETYSSIIEKIIQSAKNQSDIGIIASVEGMKKRIDRKHILKSINLPILFLFGMYDNYIPFDAISLQTSLPKDSSTVVLEQSGHMGFIEEKEKSLNGIRNFIFCR